MCGGGVVGGVVAVALMFAVEFVDAVAVAVVVG